MTKTQETRPYGGQARHKQIQNFKLKIKFSHLNKGNGFEFLICVLFVSCILYLISYDISFAQLAPAYAIYLDKDTIQKGYTAVVPNNGLQIGVLPNTVKRPVTVEFYHPIDLPPMPKDKILISPLYIYAIVPATDNTLETPINIKFTYPEEETGYKEIYIYDFEAQLWQHLPGGVDDVNNYLTTATDLASGLIGIFADNLARSEYLKAKINAPTILVIDAASGKILVERQSDIKRPIASLTKMMTAAVFLDNNPGWAKQVVISKEDDAIAAKLYVNPGAKITVIDLFYATLVHSANNAAKALARSTGLSNEQFVKQMNDKAKQLGMSSTAFAEPTGLSARNQSTASDYLKLSAAVLADPLFLQATTIKKYTLTNLTANKKIILTNANKILDSPYIITGSKTGYTPEAGRNVMARAKNRAGKEVYAIIMGADKPSAQWDDMNLLLDAALGEHQ